MKQKNLESYQQLPYRIVTEPHNDEDGEYYWTAEYPNLRGCKTKGATRAEAITNVRELFDEYITDRLSIDKKIPEPKPLQTPVTVQSMWVELPSKVVQSGIKKSSEKTISDISPKNIPFIVTNI